MPLWNQNLKIMADNITIVPNQAELERQFAFVNSMIERYRSSAISMVNTAALQMNWEIGQYISMQLKSARWGTKIVSDLADYLKRTNHKQRGFGKRHLYNMVKFYDTYSAKPFLNTLSNLHLPKFVQSRIAQLETPSKSVTNEIVQLGIAQLEEDLQPLPKLLSIIPFTSHIEIMNRCRSDEERIFYMLYARYQGLKTEELRRCIVNQTFSSLMDKEKMLSPKLLDEYPQSEFMLKDKAIVDFLNLPQEHNEHHLHKGLLEHMKAFILELGKDFLFIESEFGVQVGGSTKRIDLLFFHRALQCLVAIELKAVDFQPEFVGKMDMYLEALDRDVKRDNENPSIGIILCPSADRSMVEYTLSRSLSPTMIAEYQRKLIPQQVLKKSLEEYCSFLQENK